MAYIGFLHTKACGVKRTVQCTAAILITGPFASILGSRQVVARGLLADTLLLVLIYAK